MTTTMDRIHPGQQFIYLHSRYEYLRYNREYGTYECIHLLTGNICDTTADLKVFCVGLTAVPVEKVKKGTLVRFRNADCEPLYVRDEYTTIDRPKGQGRYYLYPYNTNRAERYVKKGTIVFI